MVSEKRPRIIAFSGPKYSGKDTAASTLFEQNRASFNPCAFARTPMAAGVKNICKEVFGYSNALMEDPVLKEQPTASWPNVAPRWPMMDIANWMRDKYGGDVWVQRNKRIIADIDEVMPHWAYVVTDWRFPEETEWLQEAGALMIYISRPEAEAKLAAQQAEGDAMALNPSESHYASTRAAAHVVLSNDTEIHNLRNASLGAVRNHFGFWYKDK